MENVVLAALAILALAATALILSKLPRPRWWSQRVADRKTERILEGEFVEDGDDDRPRKHFSALRSQAIVAGLRAYAKDRVWPWLYMQIEVGESEEDARARALKLFEKAAESAIVRRSPQGKRPMLAIWNLDGEPDDKLLDWP